MLATATATAPDARAWPPVGLTRRAAAGVRAARGAAARARAAGAVALVALVALGLVLAPGLWLALAGGAWAAGGPLLAVPPGLLGGLALLGVGLLARRAAGQPGGSAGAPAGQGARWGR